MTALAASSTRIWPMMAAAALTAPAILAYNTPPSATFLNQAAALIGWGGFCAMLAQALPPRAPGLGSGTIALLASFALLLVAALGAPLWTHLPWALALSSAGMLLAALLAALVGASAQRCGIGVPAFRAFCIGLVVAGIASSAIGIVQVFVPQWADGDWIAHSTLPGRAVGNLRQPNHLSSLLIWSTIAVLWLAEAGALKRRASTLLALLFVFVVVLSASRTGAVSVGLLALWGLLDKRLSRPTRTVLLLAPVAYLLFWAGTSWWADHGNHVFGGEKRFSTKGDISSSRYAIWSNTLALIAMHPWAGVGFGEFNFAWTLTPFPDRPVAFFDHTHNLILQFAVELGLPLAAAVLALLLHALYRALRAALRERPGEAAPLQRAAFMMVFLILLHSLLEYPLWYAYFLLPAAFAFGLCLAEPAGLPATQAPAAARETPVVPAPERMRPLLIASMLLAFGGFASLIDYMRVVVIFAPTANAPPLAQRIEDGRHSVLFAHHADYAAATTSEHPADVLASFARASHYLLDARLMQAWAIALDEAGDADRARYVAARLREFRNEQADAFFEACEAKRKPGAAAPFQCSAPTRPLVFEDFR